MRDTGHSCLHGDLHQRQKLLLLLAPFRAADGCINLCKSILAAELLQGLPPGLSDDNSRCSTDEGPGQGFCLLLRLVFSIA